VGRLSGLLPKVCLGTLFFLNASKDASRRWCSMATRGSSAKPERYYWRRKGEG